MILISDEQQSDVIDIVKKSPIYKYNWKQRGVAPTGYTKGMGVSFAECLLNYREGGLAELEMGKIMIETPANDRRDALSWFNSNYRKIGLNNDKAGEDTLRHLFVMMLGLGMRESAGTHCDGRDRSARNTTSTTAEAGMFQMSWDINGASNIIPQLLDFFKQEPEGFKDIFSEGVVCSRSQWEYYGSGTGLEFQKLSKECPLFAVKVCGVGLRNRRTHWGPVNRKELELKIEADEMFKNIADLLSQ